VYQEEVKKIQEQQSKETVALYRAFFKGRVNGIRDNTQMG
jgi:hypothetical protein